MDDFEKFDDLDLNIADIVGDTLPDLPTKYDDRSGADESEQDAFLHPAGMDLDEYLSYSEYEEQEEAEPETARRQGPASAAAKKKGGLFGFLRKRGAEMMKHARAGREAG